MAPGLVSAEKAARGKRPTDVWFHTIVPTNGREKTGYPTQKPEGVLRRLVAASSRPGGWCLDPFAGSGTLGAVCRELGRRFVLVDDNPVAVQVMRQRLAGEPAKLALGAADASASGVSDQRHEPDRFELRAPQPVGVRRARIRCWLSAPTGATSRPPSMSCSSSTGGTVSPVAAATLIASNGACAGSPVQPSPTTNVTLSSRVLELRAGPGHSAPRGARSSTRGRPAAPAARRGSPIRCRRRAHDPGAPAPAAPASGRRPAAARSSGHRRSAARRFVRPVAFGLRHESLARNRRNRREHASVADRRSQLLRRGVVGLAHLRRHSSP